MLIKPSAFNALSARLIEQAGFEVMGLSGAAVSASLLGKPDVGLVTLDEMVAVARYITGVTSVPLLADGGVGFGNAINTMRATEGFVRAGAAGIDISDRTGPGRYGDGRQTISLEEAVGKIRACAKVRDELDPDFLIVARTQAGVGLDEAIRRGNGYLAAGADMILPDGLGSEAEIAEACRRIDGPVCHERTGASPAPSNARLAELGLAMVGNPMGALGAAARAMADYMDDFAREDAAFLIRFLDQGKDHPTGDLHGFVGFSEIRKLEEEFLPADETAARYDGSIGYTP